MVTLDNKDADFIAKLARENIESIQTAYTDTLNEMDKIMSNAEQLCAKSPTAQNLEGFGEVKSEYEKVKTEITKETREKIRTWNRVVELMLGGSDV